MNDNNLMGILVGLILGLVIGWFAGQQYEKENNSYRIQFPGGNVDIDK